MNQGYCIAQEPEQSIIYLPSQEQRVMTIEGLVAAFCGAKHVEGYKDEFLGGLNIPEGEFSWPDFYEANRSNVQLVPEVA